jgi:hypothetical protein
VGERRDGREAAADDLLASASAGSDE